MKFPDPPVFRNDGNPTRDMEVKLGSETTLTEREKMGYILSRTGKNPRALIQTGYLAGKYTTAQDMMQTLDKAYNDPYKKTKARAMYRNLRMGERERFDNFLSKFTTYAAQADITDDLQNTKTCSKRSRRLSEMAFAQTCHSTRPSTNSRSMSACSTGSSRPKRNAPLEP